MGGFYGSVQVRTEDRRRVVEVADAVARKGAIRCLVGPNLNGWVGVYPEGSGQDQAVGEFIAREVGGEVLHILVHDDDVMAYWFWLNGEPVDSYWSAPGYFNPNDTRTQLRMAGDPVAFGPLVAGKHPQFIEILKREQHDFTMEAARMQRFAELLGIHNCVTSYEYLKGGERVGIEGWDEFDDVPAEAVAAEQALARQKRLAIAEKKGQFRREWILLADVIEDVLVPKAASVAGGMLVTWEGFGRGDPRIDFYRPPWGESEPGEIETGGQVNAISSDNAGRRVAMALGNRVTVWNAKGWQPTLELVESDWAVNCALSADGRLVAYASREGTYIHDIETGKRITSLRTHDGPALAFDPSGEWLVSAGSAVWIARVAGTQPWRELYPGGQTPLAPEVAQSVQKQMSKVDLETLEQKWRTNIEAAVQKLAAVNAPGTANLIARMREQLEKQVEQLRANFANLKAGKLPPPRAGNENVMCAGFTRDGTKFFTGTDRGIRVYDWKEVLEAPANGAMPKPMISHEPSAATPGPKIVYTAVEIPGRNALLFGGYAGKICHLDLTQGDVRELASPPDGGAITGITLSEDQTAIGVCSRPSLGEGGNPQDERAVWQIWSYPALLKMPG